METPLVSIIIVTYNREKDVDICIDSVLKSTYKNQEIIVVDNASTDGTVNVLETKYKDRIQIIASKENLMAGGGRNLGAENASGELLLFIDSDNIVDKDMVSKLVEGILTLDSAGMAGPLMYYGSAPNRIWWAGADISLLTSRTKYLGHNQDDKGQFNHVCKVGHIPNVFIVKKEVWRKFGGIDKIYGMHYEESDLAERLKKQGYKLYLLPQAKTWHNIPLGSKNAQFFGLESEKRLYCTVRNRIIFMKKHAPLLNYLVFASVFNPMFCSYYLYQIAKNKKFSYVKTFLKGVKDGLLY